MASGLARVELRSSPKTWRPVLPDTPRQPFWVRFAARASPLATGYWVALRTLNRPTTGSLPSKSNTGAVTRSNTADTFAANGV